MKTVLVGKIDNVQPIQTKENYSSQNFDVIVQDFDPSTGEPKPVQIFPITVFNKNIAAIAVEEYVGKRVAVTCWLRSIKNDKTDKVFYNIALNATNVKEV